MEKVDVLSHHEAICVFTGIRKNPCMFRTALCPDRCGHSSNVAFFNVEKYIKYEKLGEYGDEKQDIFTTEIDKPVFRQDPKISEKIKTLKNGQKVRIVYDHLYVRTETLETPERPFIELEVL